MTTIYAAFRHTARTAIAFVLDTLAEPDAPQAVRVVVRSDRADPNMRNQYGRKRGGANGL